MDQTRRDGHDDLDPLLRDFLDRIRDEPIPDALRDLAATLARRLDDRAAQDSSAPVRSAPPDVPSADCDPGSAGS